MEDEDVRKPISTAVGSTANRLDSLLEAVRRRFKEHHTRTYVKDCHGMKTDYRSSSNVKHNGDMMMMMQRGSVREKLKNANYY